MSTTQIKEVPGGYVLLQRHNGEPLHAACLDGGRFHGWLFAKGPERAQWVSVRKLEAWEVMQAPRAQAEAAPVASAEPFDWFHTKRNSDGTTFSFSTSKDDPTAFPLFAQAAPAPADMLDKAIAEIGEMCRTIADDEDPQYTVLQSAMKKLRNLKRATPAPEAAAPAAISKTLPCPFCGSTEEVYGAGNALSTYCDNCGADGPCNERDGKPVALWNDRAAPVASQPAGGVEPSDDAIMDKYKSIATYPERLTSGDYATAIKLVRAFATPSPAAAVQTEPMVRFCPHCASIGEIDAKYRNCCPDGSAARVIPQKLAEVCRDTFKLAIDGCAQAGGAEGGAAEAKGGAA